MLLNVIHALKDISVKNSLYSLKSVLEVRTTMVKVLS